jgi:Protein of unknown function (DUF3703)
MNYRFKIKPFVDLEVQASAAAVKQGSLDVAFAHLERAHVLGQASTVEHVRIHCLMFLWGLKRGSPKEMVGQIFRIVGAATKTAIGFVPSGNTGGANISPFKRLPIEADLAAIIKSVTVK